MLNSPMDSSEQEDNSQKPQSGELCLVMIVKDEAPVIKRCLEAVIDVIDYWVIVDTGSTDGTQQLITDILQNIPGQLYERPWVDFGHNRSEAMRFARGKGRYALVVDADEVLIVAPNFDSRSLSADAYMVKAEYGELRYLRKQILRNDLDWRYEGILHEHAVCEQSVHEDIAEGIAFIVHHDGARARDSDTYRRDALLLETALITEPDNSRYVFYLAQSYRDLGDFQLAYRNYERRKKMGHRTEEVWFSQYQMAWLSLQMGASWTDVLDAFLAAYQENPSRAEPLYHIGMHYQNKGDHHTALMFFKRGLEIAAPSEYALFVERSIYNYRLGLALALSSNAIGDHETVIRTCNELLTGHNLPAEGIRELSALRRKSFEARLPPAFSEKHDVQLKICIPFCDPGPDFDDLVESLVNQSNQNFEMVFIDDGSDADFEHRLPLELLNCRFIKHANTIGQKERARMFIYNDCEVDDVVAVFDTYYGLANSDIVTGLLKHFEDRECLLLYGQHRSSTGHWARAVPAASAQEFEIRQSELADCSIPFFRAGLCQEHENIDHLNENFELDAVFNAAGYSGSRFVDKLITMAGPTVSQDKIAIAAKREHVIEQAATPMISCLMVTRDRVSLVKRAINCFVSQTYPHRELVILSDGDIKAQSGIEAYIKSLGVNNIRLIRESGDQNTLAFMRNKALDHALGEIICQWDDDDCYHPQRLEKQMSFMLQEDAQACFLTNQLQYLETENALLWIDWNAEHLPFENTLIPGTLMMFKNNNYRYLEEGPHTRLGEDSVLLQSLYNDLPIAAASHLGHLYLYTYHGRNSFDKEHHYRMSTCGLSVDALKEKRAIISDAMQYYPIEKPYSVIGHDGPAYQLNS